MPTVSSFRVSSPGVVYSPEYIFSEYDYETVEAVQKRGETTLHPRKHRYSFRTERKIPKLGVMFVGWGGNNGSTVTAGVLANKLKLKWRTKDGVCSANYFGSLTQASTVKLGSTQAGEDVFVPFGKLLPMVNPDNLVISGWDINGANLAAATARARVLPWDLQRQLEPLLVTTTPLPSIYYPDFIASNQEDRADHVLKGSSACQQHLDHIRKDIREFKEKNELDKVIVLWTANTERFADAVPGVNDNAANLLQAIKQGHSEVAPSQMFAVAAILENCPYINGSPQNTFVPGVLDLARQRHVFVGGDDFKSGQTKLKSVLVDFLVSAGIKPESIVSYNHLGNNDGKNLQSPKQFRSKEISKSDVVNDVVKSNELLFPASQQPDHCVVIKYVPFVGDSKRALDEYTSSIFMNGKNTIVLHNTCEDSLLAAPLIIDLVVLTELCERICYKTSELKEYEPLDPILSILSYLLKAPLVPQGTPVVNALFKQRACIENIMKACLGLPVDSNMLLEHKTQLPLPSSLA